MNCDILSDNRSQVRHSEKTNKKDALFKITALVTIFKTLTCLYHTSLETVLRCLLVPSASQALDVASSEKIQHSLCVRYWDYIAVEVAQLWFSFDPQ